MKNLDKVYAERIAQEYAPKTTTKVMQLHKLDRKVKKPALVTSIILGIIGTLTLGAGMSIIMTDIVANEATSLILGVSLGLVGILILGINYPIYSKILKTRKEKYAFDIITLAKEISESDSNI